MANTSCALTVVEDALTCIMATFLCCFPARARNLDRHGAAQGEDDPLRAAPTSPESPHGGGGSNDSEGTWDVSYARSSPRATAGQAARANAASAEELSGPTPARPTTGRRGHRKAPGARGAASEGVDTAAQTQMKLEGKLSWEEPATAKKSLKLKNQIEELLGPDLGDVDDDECCPTCLDPYDDSNPKMTTRCGHHFHLPCILEWRERSRACPVCGKKLKVDGLEL